MNDANAAVDSLGKAKQGSGGLINSVSTWMNENKGLTQVAGMAAMGLGQSLITSDKDKAIIEEYERRKRYGQGKV